MDATEGSVDLERLMKLRLVVARYGEMDLAGWWNAKGMLGRLGGMARQLPHALFRSSPDWFCSGTAVSIEPTQESN